MTTKERESNKVLRNQLAELNKNGRKCKIKKWQDSAKEQLECSLSTDNYQNEEVSSPVVNAIHPITCLFTNAQSILNKFSELQAIVCDHSPQFIGIAESWCTSYVCDAELHLQRYSLFHNDRQSGVGGGVLLYISENLAAVPCKALNDVGFDNSLWYTISLSNNDKLLVGVVYRVTITTTNDSCQL